MAAGIGFMPCSMWRKMFSSTTMASSTTRPMASTKASSVSVFTLKPSAYMMPKVVISEIGMVTIGMIEARIERRNTTITSTTSSTASKMVWNTDLIERSMNTALSLPMAPLMPSGRLSFTAGSTARTPAETSSGLATACLIRPTMIAASPLKRLARRSSAAPSSTRATSLIWTCAPSARFTTMLLNCSTLASAVRESTVNSRSTLSMRPEGISTFCALSASSTSWTVRL